MDINYLFKYSFVISVDDTRYDIYKKVFSYYHLPLSEKIGKIIEGQSNIQNCGYNHLTCVKIAKERNYPHCLIFEDDAYPRKDIVDYLNNFDVDCKNIDILYLGCFSVKDVQDNIQKDLYKCVDGQQGSHAYIIYPSFYEKFINIVENNSENMSYIDLIYKYTNKSYLCKDRLFEQYSPHSVETEHIHKYGSDPGKFVSEFKFRTKVFKFYPQHFERII